MSVQEQQAVLLGETNNAADERVAVVQFPDGSITLFGLPENVTYEKFSEQVDARPATYEDLAAFNSTIVSALVGHGEYLIDLTQEELCNLYNSTLQAIISLESNRYDQSLGI